MPTKKNGSNFGRPTKKISSIEKEWADLIVDSGLGPIEAARKVFGWRCEPNSSEAVKAINLRKSPRIKEYIVRREEQVVRETEAHKLFLEADELQWDQIRKFAFDRLTVIRDDDKAKSQTRFNAIKALERLADPAGDAGLILMWLELLWRGAQAHCPCCHSTFPMWEIKNDSLEETFNEDPLVKSDGILERRMEVIKRADRRKRPHPGQIKALAAPERHLAGLGAARAGKSVLLAWLALLHFLIPGVEIWILSRIYEDARSEVEYLRNFLKTIFFPYENKVIKESWDSKSGELTLRAKWGSELRIRSAKAKGSITGRELECAFVAEPGWVPEDIYEELRARMSSRLGRIIMFGTPKGFGGILGRVMHATGRDPETGQVIRIPPEKRTIAAGMSWGFSLFAYNLSPSDNPEYVRSELDTARMELSDSEYQSEFEGLMSTEEGAKFPQVKERHLVNIPFEAYQDSVFVLGIDQGPKNFAATLLAYDGRRVYAARDYFESDNRTMMHHMEVLRGAVPNWIRHLGGDEGRWRLTIFDADPPLLNELNEFEMQGRNWPSEVTFRPKNTHGKLNQTNWRKETYEYLNGLAAEEDPKLLFDMRYCTVLHDQVRRVQNKPDPTDRDTGSNSSKGWTVVDPFRGDHVLDALVLALWTIRSDQLILLPSEITIEKDPYAEARNALSYKLRVDESKELAGMGAGKPVNEDEIFSREFGRPRGKNKGWFPMGHSPYKDY